VNTYPELSVVILCYGAGERVYGFVDRVTRLLDRFIPSWEMILVGNYIDGRRDRTSDIVEEVASKRENIHAVVMPKKGMMGWDARSGLERARGRYVCLIDGDEQMPYRDIVRVYRKIKKDDLDIVKTYRAVRHDGFKRVVISLVYNFLFMLLFPGIAARDINSKPKIFRKEIYGKMDLRSDDWFLDAEIMIKARKLKLKVGMVPSKFYKCDYRGSFVKMVTILEFLRNMARARLEEFGK
jgi:glycosyltransferase involved in cell wall biosynthesis